MGAGPSESFVPYQVRQHSFYLARYEEHLSCRSRGIAVLYGGDEVNVSRNVWWKVPQRARCYRHPLFIGPAAESGFSFHRRSSSASRNYDYRQVEAVSALWEDGG